MKRVFFEKPSELREWLEEHHDKEPELIAGFYNKRSGKPVFRWLEWVDQALCFGWIDGVRKTIDAERYTNRFTPRRPGSNWSEVNIKRVGDLQARGLMHAAGMQAFEARKPPAAGTYSYEQRDQARLSGEQQRRFESEPEAWEYFQSRPPWYRKTATWWVVSAKREETQERRLSTLIEHSAKEELIPPLDRRSKA